MKFLAKLEGEHQLKLTLVSQLSMLIFIKHLFIMIVSEIPHYLKSKTSTSRFRILFQSLQISPRSLIPLDSLE